MGAPAADDAAIQQKRGQVARAQAGAQATARARARLHRPPAYQRKIACRSGFWVAALAGRAGLAVGWIGRMYSGPGLALSGTEVTDDGPM
jgi:hypothetical protein